MLMPMARNPISDEPIMKTTGDSKPHDWRPYDGMTDAERHAAAMADPAA